MSKRPSPETLAAHGPAPDGPAHGVVPPVHLSASYERDPDGGYPGGHSYTRDQNPGYDAPEALLAELDGGAAAMLYASGMAAATAFFDTLPHGSGVVAPEAMYFTLRRWLEAQHELGRLRVEFVPMEGEELVTLRDAVAQRAPAVVWLESPANPRLEVTDLAAASAIAKEGGATVVVDGTLATPVLTRPLEHGADLVFHSASKQLNGHADVVAGVLVTAQREARWERLAHDRGTRGPILGPFEAWLLHRGLRTLFLRVRRSAESALAVAEALREEASVTAVSYPGLPEHPGHAIAARQMDGGFGPLVSFRVDGGEARARAVASRLRWFRDATSLGGVESLVEQRATIEGAGTRVPADLLRLSIGLESPDDLVADLRQALA